MSHTIICGGFYRIGQTLLSCSGKMTGCDLILAVRIKASVYLLWNYQIERREFKKPYINSKFIDLVIVKFHSEMPRQLLLLLFVIVMLLSNMYQINWVVWIVLLP